MKNRLSRHRRQVLVTALAILALRALTPDGYMPGSAQSGLLFELCPDGMPAEVMRALAGASGHHHHGHGDDLSGEGTEQCPIGHMLASAVAADVDIPLAIEPDKSLSIEALPDTVRQWQAVDYRSRSPPA